MKKLQIKSQIFSVDMIISLGIFVIILIASAWAWDSARERIYLNEQRNDLEMVARNAASSLLETNGNPSDWYNMADFNENTASSIGLAKNIPFFLDMKKVLKLQDLCSLNCTAVKNILGIKGPGYELFINITGYSNGAFGQSYEIGLKPDSSAEDTVVIERTAADDVQWSKVVVIIWRHK